MNALTTQSNALPAPADFVARAKQLARLVVSRTLPLGQSQLLPLEGAALEPLSNRGLDAEQFLACMTRACHRRAP